MRSSGALSLLALTAVVLPLCVSGSACSAKNPGKFSDDDAGVPDSGDDQYAGDDDGGTFGNVGDDSSTNVCVPDPGNFDAPDSGCPGTGAGPCDKGLAIDGPAGDFAKAIGLCQTAKGPNDPRWGVISADYQSGYSGLGTLNDGQHGILTKFGGVIKPREGASLGALSSGWAREWDDAQGASGIFKGGVSMQGGAAVPGGAPSGYPKPAGSCVVSTDVFDVSEIKLVIKVPKNAQGLQFDFDFWSGEWPEWVCSPFNDSFIAFLRSSAFNKGVADNVSFDAKNNPVGVNIGFFDRCTQNTPTGCAYGGGTPTGTAACPGGTGELTGTGFLDLGTYCGGVQSSGGGATGWLTTTAPVKPGEVIELDFIVWDTGDSAYDSTVLIDNFQWIPTPTQTGTTRPPR